MPLQEMSAPFVWISFCRNGRGEVDISALVAWLVMRSSFRPLTSSATGSVFSCRPRVDSDESTGCTVLAIRNIGLTLNNRKQYFSFKIVSESENMFQKAEKIYGPQKMMKSDIFVRNDPLSIFRSVPNA